MKPRITVIDDSQMIINFLEIFLSNKFDLRTYHKGSEAISDILSEKYHPDCVITDYNMPNDMSGPDVIDEIKRIRPNLPVMVLSGSTEMSQRINCIDRGAFDFMEKPFNPMELESRINRTLKFFKAQSKNLQHAI
jgi:DNA-binding NtrC family response regulator